jgi:arabinose-5-phosphate isomerase
MLHSFLIDPMQVRNLTRDEFAMNHPAGRIGRRLILRVADVMLRSGDIPTIHPDTLVMDALGELTAKGLGCILVIDTHGGLLGTFTDGDLRRSLQQRGAQVGQVDDGDTCVKGKLAVLDEMKLYYMNL